MSLLIFVFIIYLLSSHAGNKTKKTIIGIKNIEVVNTPKYANVITVVKQILNAFLYFGYANIISIAATNITIPIKGAITFKNTIIISIFLRFIINVDLF